MSVPSELRHDTPPDTRAAIIAHEVNRLWRAAIGEDPGPTWDEAPGETRARIIDGVRYVLDGASGSTPDESHDRWVKAMERDGWTYGPTQSVKEKTHPNMVPFGQLSKEQKQKDALFLAIIAATA